MKNIIDDFMFNELYIFLKDDTPFIKKDEDLLFANATKGIYRVLSDPSNELIKIQNIHNFDIKGQISNLNYIPVTRVNKIFFNIDSSKINHDSVFVNDNILRFEKNRIYESNYLIKIDSKINLVVIIENKISFVNVEAVLNSQIKPLNVCFKNKINTITINPYSNNTKSLVSNDSSFQVNYILYNKDRTYFGFEIDSVIFWISSDQLLISSESTISRDGSLNYEKTYYNNLVKANSQSYYEAVEVTGVTKKINDIINNFDESSTSSALYKKSSAKVGIICDEFLFESIKDSADLKYIPFSEELIVDKSLDVVLFATTWQGIDGSWQYVANPKGHKREILIKLIEKYNKLNIPTVFYSKEDPVNYDRFVSVARHCKFILTSAVEMINQYIQDTGNENVNVLEFSINPLYHNPLGKILENDHTKEEIIFAGSWMKKYPERNKETEMIFDAVIESDKNLNIIDRNYTRRLLDYQFPTKYIEYISKTINHNSLMKLHKATNYGINLNSVKYSNTMFANRVYELQAMGNVIISNYSVGVNNKFPNVLIANMKDDVEQILKTLSLNNNKELIAKGISQVMLNDTAYHRMHQILQFVGKESNLVSPKILVVGESIYSKSSFNRQLSVNNDFCIELDIESIDLNKYDFIAYFKDDVFYEEYYLRNLLSGFAYSNVKFVEMNKNEYTIVNNVKNKYLAMEKINSTNYKTLNIPITEIFDYSLYKQNINEEKLLTVIIPIHNNGKYLEEKCFRSLHRSSVFDQMEIIMIDDGSTDIETIALIERLKRRHPDIRYFKYDEGSGSASRPRNKGISMANTKYITFLDPDNEATGDSYAELLKEMIEDDSLDYIVGNMVREDNTKKSLHNYYYYVRKFNDFSDIVENTKQFLIDTDMRAQSIQALIVKTSLLKENNLKMIEGAAGQDTLFYQEMMIKANKFKAVPIVVHMYYAAVTGSVTTTIKKSFFEKYYILELERLKFLKDNQLFKHYVNERFPYYFENWYIKRYNLISHEQKTESKDILLSILNMYLKNYTKNDPHFLKVIDDFVNN